MPVVGFGTYKLKDAKTRLIWQDGDVGGPLKAALKAGYRLIDTAQVYDNDKGIAAAIKASLQQQCSMNHMPCRLCRCLCSQDSGIQRSDIFIQTKVWRSSHGYDRTMKAFKQTVKRPWMSEELWLSLQCTFSDELGVRLGVEYLDLYLIHWPGPKTGWPLPRGQTCPPDKRLYSGHVSCASSNV
eukprot:5728097-Amphidinium_carterae.1